MLTSADIVQAVERMHRSIASIRDELNAADRHLGDGDTGMTIAQLVAAWLGACADLPADVGAALMTLGRETRRATGSSLGSVLAIGLSSAGKKASGQEGIDRAGVIGLLAVAAAAITDRSGATSGDKTILDSLLRIERDLGAVEDPANLLYAAVDAAAAALAEFRARESRLGRARIYGAKSIGHDDPGMLAAFILLRAACPSP